MKELGSYMFTKKKLVISVLTAIPLMGVAAEGINPVSTQEEGALRLDALVVTATMEAKKIEDVPAFSTIVTKDDIAKSSVSSIADLLRETAGVNNLSDSTGRDEIQIRGLSGEYTVLLVNGKRVLSSGAFDKGSDTDLNSVPLNAVERIEIIRGPMSVLYGADAIGGVVNIITKKPDASGIWTGSINAETRIIGSGNGGDQYRLGVSGMGAISDQLALSISVEDLNQKAWFATDKDISPLREKKHSQNLASTLTWQIADNQEVDIDFGYNHDKRPYQAFSDTASREQEITRLDLAITHKGQWSWADTTAYIKRETSDVYDYNSQYGDPKAHDNLEANNTYAKVYATKEMGIHSIMAGLDYQNEQIKNGYTYLDTGEYNSDQYGVFAQSETLLTDDLVFTLGGRVDDHDVYGSNFSPKAYLVYDVNPSLTLKGGVTKAFKAPDASKLSEEYRVISCGGGCYLSGNPDLDAETSVSYEFGFDYHDHDSNLTASIFRNEIDNLIERNVLYTGSDPTGAEWVNVAKAMTQGLEVSASSYLTDNLTVKANYTFLDTEAEDSSGDKTVLTGRPEHQASLSFDYQASNILSTYVSVNYLAGMQYFSWVSGVGSVYDELPSYYRSDIGLIADLTDDLVLRAGIKNITDVRLDEEDTGFTTYELGRNYFVSAAYRF